MYTTDLLLKVDLEFYFPNSKIEYDDIAFYMADVIEDNQHNYSRNQSATSIFNSFYMQNKHWHSIIDLWLEVSMSNTL